MPIKREDMQKIVSSYNKITVGVLGSHSAEEVGIAAKTAGLPTVVVCQKGRERLYARYNKYLYDNIIVLDKFSDMANDEVIQRLVDLNTVFIPNRSFSVYLGYENIEQRFKVPLYGNRMILRAEERTEEKSQYWLLEKGGIRIPKKFVSPDEIDCLAIVKVQQKMKPLERAFFYASSPQEYHSKAEELIEKGVIDAEALKKARIEEYVLGQKFNANFQGWALNDLFGDFDFVGFDDRKQTNLHGILSLPAKNQLSLNVSIKNEEIGHYGLTMRESVKPLVYDSAEKFVAVCRRHYPPGIIGLFALQGAIAYDSNDPQQKKLAFYVFDVSPRIPGCPCVGPTSPEMRRLSLKFVNSTEQRGYSKITSPMDLPILEIMYAFESNRLSNIVT